MSWNQKDLLDKAKQGDIDSFEYLIEGIKVKGYQIALSYLKNEEDAKDALQDSFVKIYRNLHRFNEKSEFSTWVYRIIVNTCLDYLKKVKRQKENEMAVFYSMEQEEFVQDIPDDKNRPDDLLVRKEKVQAVIACLDALPEKSKEILLLRDMQGFSYDEIAKILECSEGTVKSRINRARQSLKRLFLEKMEQTSVY